MTIKERIAKILIDLPFDEKLDKDVNAYAMALAEAIENDMESFDSVTLECMNCTQSIASGCDGCCPHVDIKGFRVTE